MADDINLLRANKKVVRNEDVNELRPEPKIPTVAEIMADLGDADRRATYEDFLNGGKLNKKYVTPLTGASLRLLGMANRTPNPNRYLESLNATYRDSQLKFDINDQDGIRGFVHPNQPNVANITYLGFGENTIPHELEHTLQHSARTNPKVEKLSFAETSVANQQKNYQASEALGRSNKMPEEQKNAIFPSSNYKESFNEFNANIASYAFRAAAKGEDFINTPEGRALFPDEASQRYYYNNILPQITSASGLRENANLKPYQPRNPNASYANQLVRSVKNFLR
jgi:hypothetical protein